MLTKREESALSNSVFAERTRRSPGLARGAGRTREGGPHEELRQEIESSKEIKLESLDGACAWIPRFLDDHGQKNALL